MSHDFDIGGEDNFVDNDKHKKILSRNIRYYMTLKGVTRQQVSKELGVAYTTFQDWYNGKSYPKMGTIVQLADYFGCDQADLIEDRIGKPIMGDEFSDIKKALIQLACTVPDEKAAMIHRVIQSILEDN